jgi:phenylacetate-coenzyme A ligase PaaK-like adenylate-forming protein
MHQTKIEKDSKPSTIVGSFAFGSNLENHIIATGWRIKKLTPRSGLLGTQLTTKQTRRNIRLKLSYSMNPKSEGSDKPNK